MKPVIMLSAKFLDDPYNFGLGRLYFAKSTYSRAFINAGGVPVMSAGGDPERCADIADGIMFTGGCDINPKRYGEEKLNDSVTVDDELDEMEFKLFSAFYNRKKPIFGICRGIQTINVAMGGTLIQDIASQVELSAHKQSFEGGKRTHMVKSLPGSMVSSLFGSEFLINTHHHQAVKKCGKGMKATAVTDEGVIEAIEHETLPIIGIQWHPERMIGEENFDLTNMEPLFKYFVELCAKRKEC